MRRIIPSFEGKKWALLSLVLFLAACSNQPTTIGTPGLSGTGNTVAPVQLNASGTTLGTNQSILMPIPQAVAAKAITNYRINKGGQPGPYEYRGADLNGDGTPELVVYLSGDAWCAKTGCTLAVLRADKHGYKPVTTIRRVKRPIRVRAESKNGWRTLVVNTGGAGMPVQTVALQFTGRGYPGNATLLPPIRMGDDMGTEALFENVQPVSAAPMIQ